MTQTKNSHTASGTLSRPARLAWLVLILATLYVCYFHNLGAIGFVGPDEPRYAWIARAMVETGDWVTPRLYGKPWFEKPVLYYWGAALSFKLFGISETAARLPSAVAALLATLTLAWLALRLYGAETARWLLLLLPTTVGMIGFSHAAATDMPFAAMLTIAMVFAASIVRIVPSAGSVITTPSASFYSATSTRPAVWFGLVFFGFFLGLAVLAKGPAAIILSGGAVFVWAVLTKRWRDAFRCLHPIAILSFCATALPWYIVCARRNPNFFRIFIIEHNFKRYLTPEFQHIQPFWFYIPILLVAFIPWTLLLLWLGVSGLPRLWRERRASPALTFLLSWPVFCLLFFSVSQSKLPGYILPAIPPIGLLLVASFAKSPETARRGFRWLVFAGSMLTIPVSLILLWLGRHPIARSAERAGAMIVAGCVLLLFTLANVLVTAKPERKKSLDLSGFCVLPILVIVLMFHTFSAPWLRWDPSGKTLAAEVQARGISPEQIFVGKMTRGQQFSLDFYLRDQVKNWSVDPPHSGYLLLRSKNCYSYVQPPWQCASNPIELRPAGYFLYPISETNPMLSNR